MPVKKVILKKGKERSLERFHPWVFSGAVQHMEGNPAEGDITGVFSAAGKFLGCGHFASSSITVRVLTFDDEVPGEEFFIKRFQNAYLLRKQLNIAENPQTTCYRLIHGEGDLLPGLICDIYNDVAVLQCHTKGMYLQRGIISKALQHVLGKKLSAIYDKSAELQHKNTGSVNEYLFGNHQGETEVKENGHRFLVNWETGQKTGFFLDQRDNRFLLGQYASGKKILNTFCYSGGFSVYALNEDAAEVHSLDSSQKAIDLTEKNTALTGKSLLHKSIVADAIPYFRNVESDYDIIILDPPAFAKHLSAKHNAIQGYRRLNEEAISKIKSGGLIFTFSCSQAIDAETFSGIIFSAAANTRRKVRVLHKMRQPADHPVNIYHPEGEYLKGLVIEVE
ncbi:MAG: class I SAM-dependent rRNA methyltransferase [Bacteroidota bacterium]